MISVELIGLDGRNLLAFLSAVGTHIALDREASGVRLSWDPETFHPTIHLPPTEGSEPASDATDWKERQEERVVDLVRRGLDELAQLTREPRRFLWDNVKNLSRTEFRQRALEAAAAEAQGQQPDRTWADFVAGLASDAAGSSKNVEYTALCVITGDSHQDFLGFMRDLCEKVTPGHIHAALFARWRYQDKGRSFRWDATEDRRYALRASDPSKGRDKEIPSMWGANRLAFEALACLPCHPRGRHLRTTGFRRERMFHWPLWGPHVTLSTLRSLLGHPAVLHGNVGTLQSMGVFGIASSRRTSVGRKRTFGPASIWPVPLSAQRLQVPPSRASE